MHYFKEVISLTKVSTSSLYACEQLGASHWKTLKKFKFFKKWNFYDFHTNRNFRKLTTDFENRTKRHASFWTLTARQNPTEQVQSVLQPEISTHFAHFRFECKILKFQEHRIYAEKYYSRKCYQMSLLMNQKHWKLWNFRSGCFAYIVARKRRWPFLIAGILGH